MHQIRIRLGSAPDPAGEAYSAPAVPLAGFKGATSNGKGRGRGRGRKKERGREAKGEVGGGVSLALILQFDQCSPKMQ